MLEGCYFFELGTGFGGIVPEIYGMCFCFFLLCRNAFIFYFKDISIALSGA
jgi:hypothetical protein